MDDLQREHLAKGPGDVAKGVVVAAIIAYGTKNLTDGALLFWVLAGAAALFYLSLLLIRRRTP